MTAALVHPRTGAVLPLDHAPLDDRLSLGCIPAPGTRLAGMYDAIVLCARDLRSEDYPGLVVVRCPFDDGPARRIEDVVPAGGTSFLVANRVRQGQRVLVAGNNPNCAPLFAALTLRHLRGCSGEEARRHVQARRPGTLGNAAFARLLDALPALTTPLYLPGARHV